MLEVIPPEESCELKLKRAMMDYDSGCSFISEAFRSSYSETAVLNKTFISRWIRFSFGFNWEFTDNNLVIS